jgi:uncharacterized protein (TIGR02118 family)
MTERPTWKLISFLKRKTGMSREEFVAYWRDVHAPLMQQQTDFWRHVRGYVQNYAASGESPVGRPEAHDGVSELWFDSFNELKAAFGEIGFKGPVKADAQEFIDLAGSFSMVTEVVRVKDPGPTNLKLIAAGHRKEGLTREEAQTYWRDSHPQLAARETPEFWSMIQRYVQNHPRSPEGVDLDTVTDDYDMCADIGLESVEAMEAAFARPDYMAIVRPDELSFSSPEDAVALVTRESVIYESSRQG